MSVYAKLMQARVKLQSMSLRKSGKNSFAGYSYFELGDFIPAVNELFSSLGLCGVVSYGVDLATLRIVDTESGGEILITSPMAEANLKGCHPIQNLGAVETYTRRYLWVTAMEIVEHDALDGAPPLDKTPKQTITPTTGTWESMTEAQQNKLTDIAMVVTEHLSDGDTQEAVRVIDDAGLEAEEKIALWTRLDSKQRAALKREKNVSALKGVTA